MGVTRVVICAKQITNIARFCNKAKKEIDISHYSGERIVRDIGMQ